VGERDPALKRDVRLDASRRDTDRFLDRPRNVADSPDGSCTDVICIKGSGLRRRFRPLWSSGSGDEIVVVTSSASLSFDNVCAAMLNATAVATSSKSTGTQHQEGCLCLFVNNEECCQVPLFVLWCRRETNPRVGAVRGDGDTVVESEIISVPLQIDLYAWAWGAAVQAIAYPQGTIVRPLSFAMQTVVGVRRAGLLYAFVEQGPTLGSKLETRKGLRRGRMP
jgi:hypothetical protein